MQSNLTPIVEKISRCSNLYRNSRLESKGITGNQYGYIMQVCNHPGVSQDTIAKKMFINKSNVARQLATLEQNGFITRHTDEEDRRILKVYPTEKATAMYPEIKLVMDEWNEKILAGLTLDQRQSLKELLLLVKAAAMSEVGIMEQDA